MAMTGTNANVTGGGIEVSNESDPLGGRTTGDDAQPVGGGLSQHHGRRTR